MILRQNHNRPEIEKTSNYAYNITHPVCPEIRQQGAGLDRLYGGRCIRNCGFQGGPVLSYGLAAHGQPLLPAGRAQYGRRI